MNSPVQAPDGRVWRVRRRWTPQLGNESVWRRFHRRFRQAFRRAGDLADADPGCLEVVGEGVVVAVMVLLVVLVVLFVAIPLIVALVDLVVILLLALLGIVARIVLRRPWVIEARCDDGTTLTWHVPGWRDSNRRRAEIQELIAAGTIPPPDPTR